MRKDARKRIYEALYGKKAYAAIGKTAVYCKICGAKIRETKDGSYISNDNYREITIVFNDGSKHETCLCDLCVDKLAFNQLELVYCLDLKQWDEEDKKNLMNWEFLSERKPVGFELGARG